MTYSARDNMIGQLAHEISGHRLKLQVLQSAAGYYLGTLSEPDGWPCSRESVEYWPTHNAAAEALETGQWNQRDHP